MYTRWWYLYSQCCATNISLQVQNISITPKEASYPVASTPQAPSPAPGNHRSAFCLCGCTSSGLSPEMASYKTWPFVTGFVHSATASKTPPHCTASVSNLLLLNHSQALVFRESKLKLIPAEAERHRPGLKNRMDWPPTPVTRLPTVPPPCQDPLRGWGELVRGDAGHADLSCSSPTQTRPEQL